MCTHLVRPRVPPPARPPPPAPPRAPSPGAMGTPTPGTPREAGEAGAAAVRRARGLPRLPRPPGRSMKLGFGSMRGETIKKKQGDRRERESHFSSFRAPASTAMSYGGGSYSDSRAAGAARGSGAGARSVSADQCDYVFKFIIIGDTGTGKSCALHQFIEGSLAGVHKHTIGVEYGQKLLRSRARLSSCRSGTRPGRSDSAR